MFCPNAADWGNVADWISGLGSFAAVVAALYIAGTQNRLAADQRKLAKEAERNTKHNLISEIMRLTAEIEAKAKTGSITGGSVNQALLNAMEIEQLSNQLESLQELSKGDPQIFGEIGRTVREASISPADKTNNMLASRFSYISQAMVKRRQLFQSLLQD